jgi:hypothetical protein
MDAEKICPINPHGNGYCKREKCALWCKAIDDEFNCGIVIAIRAIDNIDAHGIEVFIRDDGHQ